MNKSKNRTEILALIAFVILCIVWGTTYLVIRISVAVFPAETFSGIRFILSGLIVMAFAILTKQKMPKRIWDFLKISTSGILMLLGGHGLVVFAEQWVHSGVTALILSLGPIFIALLELIILKKKTLNVWGWVGLFTGFIGVLILVVNGKEIGSIDFKGGVILLAACLLFAAGSIFSKKYSADGSIVSQLAIQMIAGGAGLLITGGILGEYSKVTINFTVVWTMIYLTIFGGIIGYGAYIYVLKHWPASKAGTYSYVNTVIAVILGAIILKEPVNVNIIFSIFLIFGGVIAVQISKVKTTESICEKGKND